MKNIKIIKQLHERNLIAQITDVEGFKQQLSNDKIITLYCGFDPTSDSLHIGHLIPIFCLKWFQLSGHKPIVLLGGATGCIGDPSFKLSERKLNSFEKIEIWIKKIKKQIALFLNFNCGENSAIIVNNLSWFKSMNILDFLRKIGKNFSINQMIRKEFVKQRLKQDELGISFTEFSYNLLQGYDFTYLNKKYNAILQIGGSDQWGNIVSGVELTRRLNKKSVFGITTPLMIKSDGKKIGKTEKDTIWLDQNKTSIYKFYQFWINVPDNEVYLFLKLFTFLDINKILLIEKIKSKKNISRVQHILAEEVTRIVHGNQGLRIAKRITKKLFNNSIIKLTKNDFSQLIKDGFPTFFLKKEINLQQALVETNLVQSYKQARTMIISNAISINGKKQTSIQYTFKNVDKLYNHYTILKKGKKNYTLIYWE